VLSALKDEIMQAAATLAEAPTAAAVAAGGNPAPECSSASSGAAAAVQSPAVPAQAAPSGSDLHQEQQDPLTQEQRHQQP
jgi:hypothetical protein